jgi:hypothetical protein
MMEGPLLEGKFGTEPSIVDADEVTDDGEGEDASGFQVQIHTFLDKTLSTTYTLLSQSLPFRYQLATSTSFLT